VLGGGSALSRSAAKNWVNHFKGKWSDRGQKGWFKTGDGESGVVVFRKGGGTSKDIKKKERKPEKKTQIGKGKNQEKK